MGTPFPGRPDPGAPFAAGRVFHPDMSGHNPTDPDYPPRKYGWRYNLLGVLIFLLFFLVLAGAVWFFGLSHLFVH